MSILDKILDSTKQRVASKKAKLPLNELKNKLDSMDCARAESSFEKALKTKDFALICEVKKASPSKGIIAHDFNHTQIALDYAQGGANAISCLTEPEFFLGSDEYLSEIRQSVSLPILRKDFIIDEYMIYEAKLIGADAILLITRILSKEQLKDFFTLASELGLDVLVETHTLDDVKKALFCGAKIIGINNRDLQSFEVDLNHSIRLRSELPDDVVCISESGIKSYDDIRLLRENGINGALIGEELMRSQDKQALIRALKGK